jgi:hypothetical protein
MDRAAGEKQAVRSIVVTAYLPMTRAGCRYRKGRLKQRVDTAHACKRLKRIPLPRQSVGVEAQSSRTHALGRRVIKPVYGVCCELQATIVVERQAQSCFYDSLACFTEFALAGLHVESTVGLPRANGRHSR